MNTVITFTLTQLVGLVLAICAAIASYYRRQGCIGRLDHAMRRWSQSMEYSKSQGEYPISHEGISGCEISPTIIMSLK